MPFISARGGVQSPGDISSGIHEDWDEKEEVCIVSLSRAECSRFFKLWADFKTGVALASLAIENAFAMVKKEKERNKVSFS
mmetsp:Transcript_47252/g.143083  ORF Transcript_47252/g.143083 Transcript_47252/m.143083 type:complete len:81 (-) Transcript_47252:2397-2639(-)